MESLHRTIENETNALSLVPVINQHVTRWVFIKEIEPKTLIDYALKYDHGKPEISRISNCLEFTIKVPNGNILVASKELKIKTSYEL